MAAARPDPIDHLTGRHARGQRPGGISLPGEGGKFATDGRVQSWPGNTFICHVDPASAAHTAIREMQEQVKMSRFARFFTFLPPSSFHMTIFQGASPEDITPGGGTLQAQTARMLGRVSALDLGASRRVRMVDLFTCHSLTMTGADAAQEADLRRARQVLRDATGIEPPGFADYVFHITMAYPLEFVSEGVARDIAAFSEELGAQYLDAVGVLELGTVAFCTFETMHHFEPVVQLAK